MLTIRQNQILSFIRNHIQCHGYPPSVREIGSAIGLTSSSTVHGHLDRLERSGFIRRPSKKSRAIEVVQSQLSASIPKKLQSEDDGERYLLYHVEDDNLVDRGINCGDFVMVLKGKLPIEGDVVVARLTKNDDLSLQINRDLNFPYVIYGVVSKIIKSIA